MSLTRISPVAGPIAGIATFGLVVSRLLWPVRNHPGGGGDDPDHYFFVPDESNDGTPLSKDDYGVLGLLRSMRWGRVFRLLHEVLCFLGLIGSLYGMYKAGMFSRKTAEASALASASRLENEEYPEDD